MAGTNYEAQHIIKSQVLHIRSEDGRAFEKDSSNNAVKTGFTIDLFEGISCNTNESFLVSLSSIEFPYSFYTTDNTNNRVKVKVENTASSTFSSVYDVVIPSGNYNANQLKSKLVSILDLQFAANNVGASLATTFDITYDAVRNKFTFKTKESDRKGYLLWTSSVNPLNKQLGFTGVADISFTSDANTITGGTDSDAVVNVGGSRTDALYVRTNLGFNSSIESRIKGISSILQKVPVQTPPNSFIFFDTAQVSSKLLIPTKNIQSVSLRITDSDDRLIDTNNINFTLSLQFDTIETPNYALPYVGRRFGENYENIPYLSNRFETIEAIRIANLQERLRGAPKRVKVKKRDREKEDGNQPQAMSFENNILPDNIETK